MSSSCVPSSTTLPCSSTQMRSAWRTVEKRCEMRIVVVRRVAARMRSKISASPRTSSWAVGSSSSTNPAPSCTAHSARASAIRCHWPPDRSEPPGRSEEHTSELQSQSNLVCRLLLETQYSRPMASRYDDVMSLSVRRGFLWPAVDLYGVVPRLSAYAHFMARPEREQSSLQHPAVPQV